LAFTYRRIWTRIQKYKGKRNVIADALSRLEKDDSSDEYYLERPTAQCMAAMISRSEILNDKLDDLIS
jgi:hypothetical protein